MRASRIAAQVAAGFFLAGGALGAREATGPVRVPDVPYLSQPKALCGGASLAMVLRYWGLPAVQPQDFAFALAPDGHGIPTAKLAALARPLGMAAFPFQGSPERVREHLDKGRPLVALLAVGPNAFHYVVLLAWNGGRVLFHDPATGPFRMLPEREWMKRWGRAGQWTLLLLPQPSGPGDATTATAEAAPRESAPTVASDPPTFLEQASLAFRNEDWDAAAALAEKAVAETDDSSTWRLLATSRYLGGRREEALQAWNAVGEPRLDLVQLDGLRRSSAPSVHEFLGLEEEGLLTPEGLRRAGRRLELLPGVAASRLDYRAPSGGRAQVVASLLERPTLPSARAVFLDAAVRAAGPHALGLDLVAMAPRGEALRAFGEWQPNRAEAAFSASGPGALGLPALVGVEARWDEQAYRLAPGASTLVREERRRFSVGVENWWTADLRAGLEVASDSFDDRGTYLSIVSRVLRRFLGDRVALLGQAGGWWSGRRPVYATSLGASARTSPATKGSVTRLEVSYDLVTSQAPLALWPGAGTGSGRERLMRGHSLLEDGVVAGDAFGRGLLRAGLETERPVKAWGPLRLSVAGFVDAAHVTAAPARHEPGLLLDLGAGLRVHLPGRRSVLRIDVASPWNRADLQLSVGWQAPWP